MNKQIKEQYTAEHPIPDSNKHISFAYRDFEDLKSPEMLGWSIFLMQSYVAQILNPQNEPGVLEQGTYASCYSRANAIMRLVAQTTHNKRAG